MLRLSSSETGWRIGSESFRASGGLRLRCVGPEAGGSRGWNLRRMPTPERLRRKQGRVGWRAKYMHHKPNRGSQVRSATEI